MRRIIAPGRPSNLRHRWYVPMLGFIMSLASCARNDSASMTAALPVVPRFAVGRLVGQGPWSPCRPAPNDTIAGGLSCLVDDALTSGSPGEQTAEVSDMAALPPEIAARQRAIIDLAYSRAAPGALRRAIAQLRRSIADTPRDASVLSALSVALLLEADRSQTLLPALQALDAAERAREVAPQEPATAWNAALALEFLRLPAAALMSWQRVLRDETDAQWRAEAQRHVDQIGRSLTEARVLRATDSLLTMGATVDSGALSMLATHRPQWRRDRAWVLLARWGECVERNDASCATAQRHELQMIAEAESRRGGDSTVVRVARKLAALEAAVPDARRRRARAYTVFGRAVDHYRRANFDSAIALITVVRPALGGHTSVVGRWADYHRAGALASRGQYEAAEVIFNSLHSGTPPDLPVLQGKALLSLGVIESRRGNLEQAVRWFRRAEPYLERAHDEESRGFAAFLMAETLAAQGRRAEGYAEALRSMRMNAGYRGSTTLRSQVTQLASLARAEQLSLAALAIGDESVAIARSIGRPTELALAYRDRARDLRVLGRQSLALQDIDSAAVWAERIAQGRGGDRLRAYVLLGRGEVLRDVSPSASVTALRSATTILRKFQDDVFLPVALHETARSTLIVGDTVAARSLLAEAITVLEAQYALFRTSSLRTSAAETAEEVFDSAIAIELAQGDERSALEVLERSKRAAYPPEPGLATDTAGTGMAALQRSLAAGTTVLEYAVLQDRIVIWKIRNDTIVSVQVPTSRDSLRSLTQAAQRAVLEGDDGTERSARTRLHELLLRPVMARADTTGTWIVVPDRELFSVPFALLQDPRTARHAIETHEIRYAPSAGFAGRSRHGEQAFPARLRLLALGNDGRDALAEDSLPVLEAAEREATQIAALHPRHRLLTGTAVTRKAFARDAIGAEVLHFAGHAVFDEARPERSYLLLAGRGDGARLRAQEIATLRTSSLRLVILSACRTLNARASRVGPASGLAYSFLDAGAAGTITSLWDVEDGVATDFMTALHRQLASGLQPAAALRHVQLEFLRSTDPARRSSRVWAGYTLTGT